MTKYFLLFLLTFTLSASEMKIVKQLDIGQWVCGETECAIQTYYKDEKITIYIPKIVEAHLLKKYILKK
ncbi:MAG: hypothetical protein V3U71_08580 [Cocleimonas sp.]